ncbi:MAG: glycosyltransferase [Desulforhopalus sp.]|nr:glycosyltransferase [Desulforhopalus sp.]
MVARKLTVVQILPELEEGGVEGETVDLAIYLARQGHRSIVISAGGRLVASLEKAGCIHLCWAGIGDKNPRCIPYVWTLRKLFLSEHIDILHLRSRLPAWIGWLAWRSLPEYLRPSLVTTFHGFYSINSYSRIMTRGERVVAVSESIYEHIRKYYHPDEGKLRLIHGGFAAEAFNADNVAPERVERLQKKWLQGQEGKRVIVLPGRITLLKGQEVLIEAMASLQYENAICLIIGDTDENLAYFRRLRDLISSRGLSERVKMVGHCSDMPAAYLLADIIISSSTQPEAFGKVAIEGMAMARPVIATAHGGSLETVVKGKTGWLVKPRDAKELAMAMDEALADPERCVRYGRAGRERVLAHFTNEAMCRATFELYSELIQEKQEFFSQQKLTVMQLLPELNSGGVERGTLEVGRYLVSHCHRSLVVSGGGRLVPQLESEGSTHFCMRIGSKSPLALLLIPAMRSLIKREHVHILHLRSRMPAWIGRLAWLTLPRTKRPVLVTTFHGFYSVNAYSAVMAKGDGVIAVSDAIKQHIAEHYGRTKNVQLIFRGVDEVAFSPDSISHLRIDALCSAWNITATRPIVALPGRLTRLKGQKYFIGAVAQLRDLDFQAVIIGDTQDNPGYTEELQKVIDACGAGDKIKMVGYCGDMPAAFTLADLVVSASSSEPEAFGRTTVEAMAMGCPVIVTAHGGSLETVVEGENGWLVKPSDTEALAAALREAITLMRDSPEKIHEMGERNRSRVLKYFSARAMCRKTLSFYGDLVYQRCGFRPKLEDSPSVPDDEKTLLPEEKDRI